MEVNRADLRIQPGAKHPAKGKTPRAPRSVWGFGAGCSPGGSDPGLLGCRVLAERVPCGACRAASEISHRRCCGNGGKTHFLAAHRLPCRKRARSTGRPLGAPGFLGGTQHAHGPTDPIVGLGERRYPKWHRPLPGGCERHPLNQPSATGCPVPLGAPPPAPRPRVSCGICDPAACPGSPRDPKQICGVSQGPAAGTSALVLGCGWGKEKGFIKTPTVLASC